MLDRSKQDDPLDLLIIGGGINGCGIARDAAGRGLKVLLCEKDDLASHTSSSSTKLIHGGLRYLEQYDFLLVHHALKEREILLESAPHIIWPLRFILPHNKSLRPRWMLRLGLFLYDHIGGRKRLPASYAVDLTQHISGKALKPEFTQGYEYSDCWVQDARLVVLNAQDAQNHGAEIKTRTRCIGLKRLDDKWEVLLEDTQSGLTQTLFPRAVVNASGPWVDKTLDLYPENNTENSIRHVKGSHIIVKKIFDHDYPYLFQHPDGRILFAIPFEKEYTLLGTTDEDYKGDLGQVEINDQEIQYICNAISQYFRQPVNTSDVIWSYSGVRPLFDDATSNISKVTRDYKLVMDEDGPPIISIYGGKITSYRVLAEKVMKKLCSLLDNNASSWTAKSALPGGDIKDIDFAQFVEDCVKQFDWLDRSLIFDYCRNYGTQIQTLLKGCTQVIDLGINFGNNLYESEVRFLIIHEWAQTSEDIIWRRTKKGLNMSDQEIASLQDWLDMNLTDIKRERIS